MATRPFGSMSTRVGMVPSGRVCFLSGSESLGVVRQRHTFEDTGSAVAVADVPATCVGDDAPVVIAGAGPAGMRTAHELCRRNFHVVLFNAERWQPYNRVQLTPLLSGEAQIGQVYVSEFFPGPGRVDRYDGVSVIEIDRVARAILTSTDRIVHYSKLILAQGSRAFVPNISGADLPGVYLFRSFDDAEALVARAMSARNVVVIGGGLLGLEAARGLSQRGAAVTVIEHENRLMPRQLDRDAGTALQVRIEALGVHVLTGTRVQSIDGDCRVEAVTVADGVTIPADTVVVCTGVRANTQLAAAVGLNHGRGIIVDDEMRTSDPDIYAVGECAEHNGTVYGLVGPGYEQAITAAASIAGDPTAYNGSVPATKLKILGADVFSMGDFEAIEPQPDIRSLVYADTAQDSYRRLFVDRGRLVAALGVGKWPEATRLQQAISRHQRLPFWKARSFARTGQIWKEADDNVVQWPREAIVCNCTGTTKGTINDAVANGASSVAEIEANTGASSVCNTCQPLVLELLGSGARAEPIRWWKWLTGLSAAAALIALMISFLPRIPLADTFRVDDFLTNLWFNSIWKQWSGYTLLGLTALAALIGLRKRIKLFAKLGGYDGWRIAHLIIGLVAAGVLIWHTGFRLGANLNLALMLSFLVTLVFGTVAGLITGGEHELRERQLVSGSKSPRSLPMWIHLLGFWPLPVLLLFHVLSVYNY